MTSQLRVAVGRSLPTGAATAFDVSTTAGANLATADASREALADAGWKVERGLGTDKSGGPFTPGRRDVAEAQAPFSAPLRLCQPSMSEHFMLIRRSDNQILRAAAPEPSPGSRNCCKERRRVPRPEDLRVQNSQADFTKVAKDDTCFPLSLKDSLSSANAFCRWNHAAPGTCQGRTRCGPTKKDAFRRAAALQLLRLSLLVPDVATANALPFRGFTPRPYHDLLTTLA
ncbi:uncharacterized protein IWZ02DRAFT_208324 [Phyllosticta citriasiana]|uniref:uncharacterized protein n=1 Tax=Phyllosticta citriasiana TaxID=595635 RepID=UPI0030FD5F5E